LIDVKTFRYENIEHQRSEIGRILRWTKKQELFFINLKKRSRSTELPDFGGNPLKQKHCDMHNLLAGKQIYNIENLIKDLQYKHMIKERA
jgi:hypothetical protein